jgi:hypothetical protein
MQNQQVYRETRSFLYHAVKELAEPRNLLIKYDLTISTEI